MKKSKKKFFINIITFGLVASIFSITNAGFNFVKTYIVDNGYLYQERYGTTVREFKEELNNPNLQVYNKAGKILEDEDKISTGDIYTENETENVIVLRGDLNGDSNMDENDFLAVKEHLIEKNILQNEYKEAADLDENGEINLTDVLLFKRIRQKEEIKVEGINLDKTSATITVGENLVLDATILPENATNRNVVWTSSNPDIAVVDENGQVTGKNEGTTIITVKTVDGEYEAICEITVTPKSVESIEIINLPTKTTYIQNYETLNVNGGKIKITYNDTSTEEKDIELSMVSGFDNSTLGNQTITVTYEGKTATFEVTIVAKSVDKIEIIQNPTKTTYIQNYETLDVTGGKIRITYNDASIEEKDMELSMVSGFDNSTLGNQTITVTYEGKTATFEITIESEKTAKLDKTNIELNVGEETTLTIITTPDNADKSYKMQIDNSSVVSIEKTDTFGILKLTALAKGTAKISFVVTVDGTDFELECNVTVNENESEEFSLQLDKTNETIASNSTIDLTAIMTGTEQTINWQTSNSVIATISATTGNSITITGKQAGTAIITATTEDGKYVATCEIKVVYPVTGVTIIEETENLTVGSKTLLSSVLTPINATNQTINWTSSDEKIAIVDEYGIVKGLSVGTVTITATTEDGNYKATCEVEVTAEKTATSASEFTYTTQNNQIIITGYTGSNTEVVIPETINGKTVKIVGGGSTLSGFDSVTSVKLPSTVTEIRSTAFSGYTNLTDIDLKNVETIGLYAFKGCTGLKKITFPDTLTTIYSYAFYECSGLNCNLIIPDSVTSIGGYYTFYKCTNLKKLKLSNNLTTLAYAIFFQTGITGPLEIPEGITKIDGYCFANTKITSIKFADSVEYIYENAFRQCSSKMEGEIVLPKNLIYWGDGQFDHARNCTNTTLVIPKTLTTIGGDQNISSSTQKKNTGYGTHTFYDFAIKSFTEFIVEEGNEYFQAIDGVLYSKDKKRLVSFPAAKILYDGTYYIEEGTEQMDELSFSLAGLSGYSTGNLRTVVLPSTFKISQYGPDNLNCAEGNKDRGICINTLSTGLYIYNGVKEIIVSEDNPDFKSVDGCVYSKDGTTLWYVPLQKTGTLAITEGTTTIEHGAFYGMYGSCPIAISALYIPSSVQYIDQYTLEYINLLPSRCTITVDENNPYWTVDSNGDIVAK